MSSRAQADAAGCHLDRCLRPAWREGIERNWNTAETVARLDRDRPVIVYCWDYQ